MHNPKFVFSQQNLRRLIDYRRSVGVSQRYLLVVGHKTVSLQLTHRKDTDNNANCKKSHL